MLTDAFRTIGKNVKDMTKKGEGIFGHLMAFAIPLAPNGHEQLRQEVKAQEKLANEELKIKLSSNSTYKVAKNLIANCVEAGISLTTKEGKPKGKTMLEEELALTKTPKTVMEKFRTAMSTAEKLAVNLSEHECLTAAALVDSLLKDILPRIKAAA